METVRQKYLETVVQEDSVQPAPPRRSWRKSCITSLYVGTRPKEREKTNNVAVMNFTKGDLQQVGYGGSTKKRGYREVKGGGAEKVVNSGVVSDITNRIGVKWVCVGGDEGSAVGKRVGSSKMASYLPKRNIKKTDGQLFSKSQLKLSTSILLFP